MCIHSYYYKYSPSNVLKSIKEGNLDELYATRESLRDDCIIYALNLGLLNRCAESFPDYRKENDIEIPMTVFLAAALASPFVSIHSLNRMPFALSSVTLLSHFGFAAKVKKEGISCKSSGKTGAFHGDAFRKMLLLLEKKEGIEEGAQKLEDWYNQEVGPGLERASLKRKTRMLILDCTKIQVPLDQEDYQCSQVVKSEKKELERGYKIASLRRVTNTGGIITGVHIGSIRSHDLDFCKEFVLGSNALKSGDLLVDDRAFIDADFINQLKQKRGVDSLLPLKSNMLSYKEAIDLANLSKGRWYDNPIRKGQEIKLVKGVDHLWDGMKVPLNACVVRKQKVNKKTGEEYYRYSVFVTTDTKMTAKQIIRNYSLRWEIETDFQLQKRPDFGLNILTSKRYIQIVFHFLRVLFAYSLFELYKGTHEGKEFEGMTLENADLIYQKECDEELILVANGPYFTLYPIQELLFICLSLPLKVQSQIKNKMAEVMNNSNRRRSKHIVCQT